MSSTVLYGGIEGGGTKFVCALARSPVEIIDSLTLPTRDARSTLAECVQFFVSAQKRHGPIQALGFSCFGPIDLRSGAAGFGRMMATPKEGWSGVNVLEPFRSALAVPVALDIDVGAAALAEWRLGAGRGLGSMVYVTVGTGIGGAAAPRDPISNRLMHAEMGHMPVRRDPRDAEFAGICPFHGDCLEGLASGPAIRARWGCLMEDLPSDHPGRSIVAGYLGQMAACIALTLSVERIVFGGGVMSSGALLPLVRLAALDYLNGYIETFKDPASMARYVCAPALGSHAGIAGSLLLARDALLL